MLKAVDSPGLGCEGVRVVTTGPQRGVETTALAGAIDHDVASGLRPRAAVAMIRGT